MEAQSELTIQESRELEQYEAEIEVGFKAFIKVGNALIKIRDKRLYREQYRTFEEYCQHRWQLGRSRAYQLIDAATVVSNVQNSGHPPPQRAYHASILAPLEPQQQRDVWSTVLDDHPNGRITGAVVQEAVERARDNGHTQEYRDFEREELLPYLHDAGHPDAPQVLSGECDDLESVPDEQQERAEASLRESIIVQLAACREGRDIDECADEILEVLGQGQHNLAIAARMGVALSLGPQTLTDLVAMAARTCDKHVQEMDRPEYLRMRKRVLRLVDAVTYSGLGIFQHEMENGQLCFGLMGR